MQSQFYPGKICPALTETLLRFFKCRLIRPELFQFCILAAVLYIGIDMSILCEVVKMLCVLAGQELCTTDRHFVAYCINISLSVVLEVQ